MPMVWQKSAMVSRFGVSICCYPCALLPNILYPIATIATIATRHKHRTFGFGCVEFERVLFRLRKTLRSRVLRRYAKTALIYQTDNKSFYGVL